MKAFQRIPGIGPKSAHRMVFHLLAEHDRAKASGLAEALDMAVQQVQLCSHCAFYTEYEQCDICANPKRDSSLLCVVENAADLMAIEQSHSYSGVYFVLRGHLSPLDGMGPEEIGIPSLLARIAQDDQLKELIIATNPTMEGQATAHYILNHMDQSRIRCSRIAYGIPLGGELEYLDSGTLRHAFYSRQTMHSEEKTTRG